MNILAKFNHDSTVKPVIVSFSGRKFMKIIGRCRVQFQWLVTGGPGGQLCGGWLLIKISIINIILMLACSHFLIANKYFMDSLVSNKWTKYFTLPAIPCSPLTQLWLPSKPVFHFRSMSPDWRHSGKSWRSSKQQASLAFSSDETIHKYFPFSV